MKIESDFASQSNETWTTEDGDPAVIGPLIKEKFYSFLKTQVPLDQKFAVFEEIRKTITFKIEECPDDTRLQNCFEKIYFKFLNAARTAKKNWSEEETTLLIAIITLYCASTEDDFTSLTDETWFFISTIFPGKKPDQLRIRWMSILRTTLSKAPWSSAEDKILCEVMGTKNDKIQWKDVAAELNQKFKGEVLRTGKQCRERWTNHLDPNINRGAWTDEEDLKLLQNFLEFGKKWSEISRLMANRTENAVKNRFRSIMRKYQKEATLADPGNTGGDWERKVASFAIGDYGGGKNNQQGIGIQTKRSDKMVLETETESPLYKQELESNAYGKPSATKNPAQVGKKKNLLMGIVREETPSGFRPMNDQNQSNAPVQNQPANNSMYGYGQSHWQQQQQQSHQHQQPQQQFGFPLPFGQSHQEHMFSQPYEQNPSFGSFNQYPSQQIPFGGQSYGMTQGVPNPFFPTSHSSQFADPFSGIPNLSNPYQSNAFEQQQQQPSNSINILSMTPSSFPRSSPSLIRNSNNPFLTAPTFPLEVNPYQNNKQSAYGEKIDNEISLLQRDLISDFDLKTPDSLFPVKASKGIKRELIEKSISEFKRRSFYEA